MLTAIQVGTTGNPTAHLNLSYNYDSFGNLKTLSDNGTVSTFSYDSQNRLTTGYPLTGATALTYTYDAAGRLTNYEGAQYRNDPGRHRVSHVNGEQRYGYNANGNITIRPGQTLYWDKENHLERVIGSGVDEQYFYDANGQRVKKVSDGVATFYPSGLVEQTGGVVTKYYFFNGQRVAMRKGGVLSYLHGDHLGSTVLETDVSGNSVGDERFLAFGKKRIGSGVGTDHGFTGQKLDGSGLQYFNARYFDPQLGTFISPDTIVPDPTAAMDFNRYMFVRGNPLKFTDPSGHACMFVNGTIECSANPVIGGLTVSIDPNSTENHQPACQGEWTCTDPHATEKIIIGAWIAGLVVMSAPAAIPVAIEAACANDGDCTNEVQGATQASQTASPIMQKALEFGSKAIETTTTLTKIESQLVQKADLLGVKVSGNMSNLSNPQVQKGLQVINSIMSNPDRIIANTWKSARVFEYIDKARGIGIVVDQSTGQLLTILQRNADKLDELESFVQNGTAVWLK